MYEDMFDRPRHTKYSLIKHCLELFNKVRSVIGSCKNMEQFKIATRYNKLVLTKLEKDILKSDAVKRNLIDPIDLVYHLKSMIDTVEQIFRCQHLKNSQTYESILPWIKEHIENILKQTKLQLNTQIEFLVLDRITGSDQCRIDCIVDHLLVVLQKFCTDFNKCNTIEEWDHVDQQVTKLITAQIEQRFRVLPSLFLTELDKVEFYIETELRQLSVDTKKRIQYRITQSNKRYTRRRKIK